MGIASTVPGWNPNRRQFVSALAAAQTRPASFPLARFRSDVLAWADSLQVPGEPYGCYRGGPGKEPDLYASLDIAQIRAVMGEDLARRLPDARRRAWIAYINSFANPADGSYQTYTHHSKLHANGMAIGALGVLGGKMKFPVRLYEPFDSPEKVGPWLDSLDWAKQWTESHRFWGGIHCFSLGSAASTQWLETVFAWLDRNLDSRTGWWRKGTPHSDRDQPLGGSVHILPIYQHHHRPFPFPKALIDSVLALQLPNGRWIGGKQSASMTYLELDALYALHFAQSAAGRYRRDDISKAVSRYLEFVQGDWQRTRDWLFGESHPHQMLAAVGTLGLLQQYLPDLFIDERRWSDIFSDIRLYDTQAVESSATR